jgi:hypothetical protein
MHLNPTQAQQKSTHVDHAINLLPGNTKLSYVTHVKLGFILIVKVWMTTCTTSWTRVTFHGNALIVGCLTFSQHFSTAQALNRPIVIPCLTVTYKVQLRSDTQHFHRHQSIRKNLVKVLIQSLNKTGTTLRVLNINFQSLKNKNLN